MVGHGLSTARNNRISNMRQWTNQSRVLRYIRSQGTEQLAKPETLGEDRGGAMDKPIKDLATHKVAGPKTIGLRRTGEGSWTPQPES